jgi:cyclophilin family peptidyl-prolyl cis-trans isomerase
MEHQIEMLHYEEASKSLKEASKSQKLMEREIQKLEKTKKALEHEIRMASELKEGETLGAGHHYDIVEGIENRHEVLKEKIATLRSYIQEESHREVLEKYGPGPHKVKMTLRLPQTDEIKSMVLEMAPLDLMPHSVHVFLEMISHRLWDNNVFWHHPGVTHVVTATTIQYQSGEPRNHHFQQLRLGGVSFAEYTDAYPHEMYTVAFAGRGPDFYINTKNNSKSHAPGTQAHHALDDEADPVFAKVVEGKDVVDSLLKLSAEATRNRPAVRDWNDNVLTHIIRVEVV